MTKRLACDDVDYICRGRYLFIADSYYSKFQESSQLLCGWTSGSGLKHFCGKHPLTHAEYGRHKSQEGCQQEEREDLIVGFRSRFHPTKRHSAQRRGVLTVAVPPVSISLSGLFIIPMKLSRGVLVIAVSWLNTSCDPGRPQSRRLTSVAWPGCGGGNRNCGWDLITVCGPHSPSSNRLFPSQ